MNDPDLSCKEEHRRDDVRAASVFGLDYAEVSDNQLTVSVFFLGKAPQNITKANILVQGGVRVTDVQVVNLRLRNLTKGPSSVPTRARANRSAR